MPRASALVRNAPTHCSNEVWSARAPAGNMSPASAPAIALSEARLAMLGDGAMLRAGLALALGFGPSSTRLIMLGGAFRARRGFPGRVARCDTRHSERVWRGRHGRIGLGCGIDLSPWHPRSACVQISRRNFRRSANLVDEPSQAVAEASDVEMQRIVVAVADAGIDGGMERRNEPMLGAD